MSAYRDGSPLRETTLWHGPFEGRTPLMLGALALAVFLLFGLLHHEANVFRSLVCQRPGRCVIARGADWYGVRTDRVIEVTDVVRVERGRTTGKNARAYLSLVTSNDERIRLFEGDEVAPREASLRAFFESRADRAVRPELAIRSSPDGIARWTFGLLIVIALLGASAFGLASLRARARFRIEIDEPHGVVRIERVSFGRPVDPIEVRLATVTDVVVESEPGAARNAGARVVLITSEGLDQPVTRGYFHGSAVATTAQELREALRLGTQV